MTIPHLLLAISDIGRIEGAVPTQGCIAGSSDAKATPRHLGSESVVKFSSGAAKVSFPRRILAAVAEVLGQVVIG